MIDGTYNAVLKTPMGAKKGELILKTEGEVLTGAMLVLGKENLINPGKVNGNEFTFTGKLKTAVGMLEYECTGSVEGDELVGIAKTKKGNMQLKGTRK